MRTSMVLAITAALLMTVAACSGSSSDSPAKPSTATVPNDKVDRNKGVVDGGPSDAAILKESELPTGWRNASGEQYLDLPNFCEIVLEPPGLASYSTRRFTQGFAGPFQIQHVFTTSKVKQASARMESFVAATKECRSSTDLNSVEWDAAPITGLTPVGDEFGAVQLTRKVPDVNGINAMTFVVFRQGDVVTVLTGYSPADLAKPEDLAVFVSAAGRKAPNANDG